MTQQSIQASFVAAAQGSDFLGGRTADDVLDLRDDKVFDEQWSRVYGQLKSHPGVRLDLLDSADEGVFKAVFASHESGDLAAYASDDLGLVLAAHAAGFEDPWLSALAASYMAGRFPAGKLTQDSRPLARVLGF